MAAGRLAARFNQSAQGIRYHWVVGYDTHFSINLMAVQSLTIDPMMGIPAERSESIRGRDVDFKYAGD